MSLAFEPDFTKGLLPVIVQDAKDATVLMLAYMNHEAWQRTLETGEAHYFSRSRKKLWHKGETSGHTQKVVAMRLDCDNDSLLLLVEQKGKASCHTGYRSCFFRERRGNDVVLCAEKIFDPKTVYGK